MRLLNQQQKRFDSERKAASSQFRNELIKMRKERKEDLPRPSREGAAAFAVRVVDGATDEYVPGRIPMFASAAPLPARPHC
eukprot:SAG31_NODE_44629_length_262_cov_0.625767_1_plen_80_part_01